LPITERDTSEESLDSSPQPNIAIVDVLGSKALNFDRFSNDGSLWITRLF